MCRAVSIKTKKPLLKILAELRDAGYIDELGKFYQTAELDADAVTNKLATILGAPVQLGPVRALPDGRTQVKTDRGWQDASEELLRNLDGEARLGAKVTSAHFAAEVILG